MLGRVTRGLQLRGLAADDRAGLSFDTKAPFEQWLNSLPANDLVFVLMRSLRFGPK